MEARQRIFNVNEVERIPRKKPKRSTLRLRLYYKKRRQQILAQQKNAESIIKLPKDPRPYASITIRGKELVGLLDSGASVSCFGSGAHELLSNLDVSFIPNKSTVKTADGSSQEIIGTCDLLVKFNGLTKNIKFYVIPSLTQQLYLGVDFWQAFGLNLYAVEELDINPEEQHPDKHTLTPAEQRQLNSVINLFSSYARDGLGRLPWRNTSSTLATQPL